MFFRLLRLRSIPVTSIPVVSIPAVLSWRIILAALAGVMLLPNPACAQFSKDYKFLEAVRKGDGQEVNNDLEGASSTIINTHDDSTGETALMIVTAKRDMTWMNYFLAKGADINATDNHSQSALSVAVGLDFVAGAKLLLEHGATPDVANVTGDTPLITAMHHRNFAMIRVLLAGGADPDRTDNTGRSARDYAAQLKGDDPIASLLAGATQAHRENSGDASHGTYGPSL